MKIEASGVVYLLTSTLQEGNHNFTSLVCATGFYLGIYRVADRSALKWVLQNEGKELEGISDYHASNVSHYWYMYML